MRDVTIVTILGGCLAGVLIIGLLIGQSFQQQSLPTFLGSSPNDGYTITFREGQCVRQIALRQAQGGMWAQTGSGDLCLQKTMAHQSVVNQALAEHSDMCFRFYKAFNGSEIFRYSTNKYCGDPWHSIEVSKP